MPHGFVVVVVLFPRVLFCYRLVLAVKNGAVYFGEGDRRSCCLSVNLINPMGLTRLSVVARACPFTVFPPICSYAFSAILSISILILFFLFQVASAMPATRGVKRTASEKKLKMVAGPSKIKKKGNFRHFVLNFLNTV